MRTTLTLNDDLALRAKRRAAQAGRPLKEIINEALRIGLEEISKPSVGKPYRTEPRPLGLRRGFSYDNVAELLARTEGEDHP